MTDITQEFQEAVLHKMRLNCKHVVDTALFQRSKVSVQQDIFGRIVYDLETYLWGVEKERIFINERFPVDWWEAFKERWFPDWLKNRYPVVCKRIFVDKPIFSAVCPHLQEDSQCDHLKWLHVEVQKVKPL